MHYEGIEYVVRGSVARDEWTLLIYFPDKAAHDSADVVKFRGSREGASAAARRRIDDWVNRQRQKGRGNTLP